MDAVRQDEEIGRGGVEPEPFSDSDFPSEMRGDLLRDGADPRQDLANAEDGECRNEGENARPCDRGHDGAELGDPG